MGIKYTCHIKIQLKAETAINLVTLNLIRHQLHISDKKKQLNGQNPKCFKWQLSVGQVPSESYGLDHLIRN